MPLTIKKQLPNRTAGRVGAEHLVGRPALVHPLAGPVVVRARAVLLRRQRRQQGLPGGGEAQRGGGVHFQGLPHPVPPPGHQQNDGLLSQVRVFV